MLLRAGTGSWTLARSISEVLTLIVRPIVAPIPLRGKGMRKDEERFPDDYTIGHVSIPLRGKGKRKAYFSRCTIPS